MPGRPGLERFEVAPGQQPRYTSASVVTQAGRPPNAGFRTLGRNGEMHPAQWPTELLSVTFRATARAGQNRATPAGAAVW